MMRVDVSSEGRGGESYPESEVTDGDRQMKLKGAWSRQKPARVQNHRTPKWWKQLSATSPPASPEIWQCRAKRSSTTFGCWHFWFQSGWMVRVVAFPFSFVIGVSFSKALLGWRENPPVSILLSHKRHHIFKFENCARADGWGDFKSLIHLDTFSEYGIKNAGRLKRILSYIASGKVLNAATDPMTDH